MLKTVPFKRTLLASMLTLASGAISAAYAAPQRLPQLLLQNKINQSPISWSFLVMI